MFIYKVTSENKYFNIKELLKSYYNMSDKLIAKLKRYKRIYKNDEPVYVTSILNENDIIKIDIDFDEEYDDNIKPISHKLNILYEDEYLLVINKEAGFPIHPSSSHFEDTVSNFVKSYFIENNIKRKIRPVNRLDRNTSGITIFAKSDYIQDILIKEMNLKTFKKNYIAITEGIPDKSEGLIDAPIARKYGSIIEREICFNLNENLPIDYKPQSAQTMYKVLKTDKKNNLSLISYTLLTGRTHQIRLHSKYINCPLLGDELYNKESNFINRQALHSESITFVHPISKEILNIIAPLPEDMKTIIDNLNFI